jgi:hypothetical protein
VKERGRSQAHDIDPELAAALMPLVKLLLPVLRAELAPSPSGDVHAWVSQDRSPLGRKAHCKLARSGALEGARKVGRKWLAPAASIAAFIERNGCAPVQPATNSPPGDDDEVAQLADELGILILTPRR